jgi:hypothetical protein
MSVYLCCLIISQDESLEFPTTLSSTNISMANFSQEMESKIMFQRKNRRILSQISIHEKIIKIKIIKLKFKEVLQREIQGLKV